MSHYTDTVLTCAQAEVVRAHFDALTKAFLNPLERYVTRLMPLRKAISPFKVHSFMLSTLQSHTIAARAQAGCVRST